MEFPLITAGLTGFVIVLQQLLMLNVGMHRAKVKKGTGFGDDLNLERKARQHGNLTEISGLFLVTLALLELSGVANIIVVGFAAAFLISRILHLMGFMSLAGSHLGEGSQLFLIMRVFGAFGSAMSGLGAGGFLLFVTYRLYSA